MSRGAEPDPVTVAYVHQHDVAFSWHHSMVELLGFDLAMHQRVLRGGYASVSGSSHSVPEARNMAVKSFLESDVPWLWWIDTDMGFAPDTVERLIEVADPDERPIVGGLCFVQREVAMDGMGGRVTAPAPTIYEWVTAEGVSGFQGRANYPANSLVRCAGTGAACVLVHRSVFEAVADKYGPVWYDRVPNPTAGGMMGEDLSFCMRAGVVGVPVHVHTGVRTSHYKTLWLAEHDYWNWTIAPPATAPAAVIVPVLGRPQNAGPFMRSLRASTGLATVYAVHDPQDTETAQAWTDQGAHLIVWNNGQPGTFAEKANLGYKRTAEPWLFFTGDDVRFHPGWLDHAQAVAGDTMHVVGTNDLGNPRVLAGEHATHLLIRRSYIDEVGASWDGPGVVAHVGYRHWYVDDEIVTAAKQRGVWAMALGSKVEHLHPIWGKGEDDDTYRLGQKHAEQDRKLWQGRRKAHA